MVFRINGRTINRALLIDDEQEVREWYGYAVEEMDIKPIPVPGPLEELSTCAETLRQLADAAICDHNLRVRDYSRFNGAELVAQWYRMGFPAILCTRWQAARPEELRRFRRHIPVLLGPDELDPSTIASGLELCIKEMAGDFRPSRRPWRTLVVVEDVDLEDGRQQAYVSVPAWNRHEVIGLYLPDLPLLIRERIVSGALLHAAVNIGAEYAKELFFEDWESQ
jgi:hypothetical protein